MRIVRQSPSPREPLLLIQALRALAALLVVVHHGFGLGADHGWTGEWRNGASGVDLFFVISGFIMAYSSRSLLGRPHPGWEFLKRRTERIYPLYWLLTTAKLLVALAAPDAVTTGAGSGTRILESFLLLPTAGANGILAPVLSWGWTLVFKMLFYVLFACALALRIRPLLVVTPALLVLAGVPLHWHRLRFPLHLYFDPIVLEFLFGMLLFEGWRRVRASGGNLPGFAGFMLVALGLACLLALPCDSHSPLRPLLWGIPATTIVAGALGLEPKWGPRMPAAVLNLGDESYSLYLVHVFALVAMAAVFSRLHLPPALTTFGYPIAGTLLAVVAARLLYRQVERPAIRLFRGRRTAAVETGT